MEACPVGSPAEDRPPEGSPPKQGPPKDGRDDDRKARFIKRNLSSIVVVCLVFLVALILLPFAFHSDPREHQVQFKGNLHTLNFTRGPRPEDNSVTFSIKQQPLMFKAAGISLADLELFALEQKGAELTFSVEEWRLEDSVGAVPVIALASKNNVYLRAGDIAELLRKSRIVMAILSIGFAFGGVWLTRKTVERYREEAANPNAIEEYDPIIVAICKYPVRAVGIAAGVISLAAVIFLPSVISLPLLALLGGGVAYFALWIKKHASKIAWMQKVLEADAKAQAHERIATAAPKHVKAVQLLLDKVGDVNVHDHDGRTPLHIVVKKGYVEAVDYLARHGARIDAQDSKGTTPLMIAAEKGALGLVTKLLELGADPLIKDFAGENAAHYAQRNKKNRGTIDFMIKTVAKAEADKAKAEEEAKKKAEEEAAQAAAAEATGGSAASGGVPGGNTA